MAFAAENFSPLSGLANSDVNRVFSYVNTDDAMAAVKAPSYFDLAANPMGGMGLSDGDVIMATASDGTAFIQVFVSAGFVTVAAVADFV